MVNDKINKTKLIFLLVMVLVFILFVAFVLYNWSKNINAISAQALKNAQTIEIALNGEMFKQLRALPEDIGTTPYESIKERLVKLVSVEEDIRFAYIYTHRDDKVYFMVDSESVESKDYSPPGQEYTEASQEIRQPFIDGKSRITKPITDRWGTWISVLTPMKDLETGEVMAILGIDYPAKTWNNKSLYHTLQASVQIFVFFLLLLAFYVIINNNEKLKQSEQKYRLLVENSYNIIYILTLDGILSYVSPAWTALLGYPTLEVIGKSFKLFVHPDDIAKSMAFIQKILETKKSQSDIEYRVRHKDGTWYWHSTSAVPIIDKKGEVTGFYGIAKDITKQKEALDETNQLNKYMVDRELKMLELKAKIKELEKKQSNEN